MAWLIDLSETAEKQLAKLERHVCKRILEFLRNRIANLDNPRSIGESLHGSQLGEFWKYRVGDYRIIARIEDKALLILVVRIGHRGKVYSDKS